MSQYLTYRPRVGTGGASLTTDSVTSAEIIDGSLTVADFAAGAPGVRSAPALVGAGSLSVSWAPTTTALTKGFVAASSGIAADTNLIGRSGSGQVFLRVTTAGDIEVKFSTTVLMTATAGFLFDGAFHEYSCTLGVDTQEVFRDGVSIGTGTGTFSHRVTADIEYIGAVSSGGTEADGFTVRDVTYTDPASSSNCREYRLDASLADALGNGADLTLNGDITWVEVPGASPTPPLAIPQSGIERRHINPGSGVQSARLAALFSGADTAVLDASWATSTNAFAYEFTITPNALLANSQIMGRTSANCANIRMQADGSLQLRQSTTTLATVAAGTLVVGETAKIRVVYSSTTGDVYKDDALLSSHTWGAITWSTTPSSGYYVGARSPSADEIDASLSDVKFEDLADTTNTARYRLDGDLLNDWPTSTVADLTRVGHVPFAPILAPGPGKPLLSKQRYMACWSIASAQTGLTADAFITPTVAEHAEPGFPGSPGSYGIFDPDMAGTVVYHISARLSETAGTDTVCAVVPYENAAVWGEQHDVTIPANASAVPVSCTVGFAITATGYTGTVRPRFSYTSGGTITIEECQVTITFFPDNPS